MDNLYIDFEQGLILGNKIKSEANDLKELLIKFEEIQKKLDTIMTEEEEEKKKIKEIISQTRIVNMLADSSLETGDFLINVSNAYKKVSEVNNNE